MVRCWRSDWSPFTASMSVDFSMSVRSEGNCRVLSVTSTSGDASEYRITYDTEVTFRLLQTLEGEGPANDDQRSGGVKTNIGCLLMQVFQDVRTAWRQLQSSCHHSHNWSRILQPDKFVAEDGRLCLADRDTVRKYGRGSRLNGVEMPPRIKPQYLYWLMTWSVSE